MKSLIMVFTSAAIGAGTILGFQAINGHVTVHASERDLPVSFGSPIGIEGPLTADWRIIHSSQELAVWVAEDVELLAVSRDDQAVLLFSYIDDIQYFDIFEDGQPKITAELASDQQRMFVYSETGGQNSWIYMDQDLDGIPDQRFNPSEEGSAQDLQVTTVTANTAD